MGELKSCLFCGKNVDRTYEYCPHCGYEFGQGDDVPPAAEERPEECGPAEDGDYLVRIRTLQEILSDMEEELDLIIRTSSKDP
jgi:hypothetical protein